MEFPCFPIRKHLMLRECYKVEFYTCEGHGDTLKSAPNFTINLTSANLSVFGASPQQRLDRLPPCAAAFDHSFGILSPPLRNLQTKRQESARHTRKYLELRTRILSRKKHKKSLCQHGILYTNPLPPFHPLIQFKRPRLNQHRQRDVQIFLVVLLFELYL